MDKLFEELEKSESDREILIEKSDRITEDAFAFLFDNRRKAVVSMIPRARMTGVRLSSAVRQSLQGLRS